MRSLQGGPRRRPAGSQARAGGSDLSRGANRARLCSVNSGTRVVTSSVGTRCVSDRFFILLRSAANKNGQLSLHSFLKTFDTDIATILWIIWILDA